MRNEAHIYEGMRRGLGREFVAEVRRCRTLIGEHPSIGARLDAQYRRFPLRRFPFALAGVSI